MTARKPPSFRYIAPIKLLDQATVSNTHLVLAHLVDQSDEYALFYKNLSKQNHYITMDCSSYELKEPYAPDKLLSLAEKCGADTIVLPDYPFEHSVVTITAANKCIPIFKDAGFKTFFVPQSKVGDLTDWINAYEWAANHPDIDVIGMSILGIPNALPTIDPSFSRVVMTSILLDRGIFGNDKLHHYLGLNGGPATEIPSLLRMNVLDTIDSSGPIWSACLGHEYSKNTDSLLQIKKPKMPVDFYIQRPKDQATLNRIKHNIALTEELFKDQTQEVWYAEE